MLTIVPQPPDAQDWADAEAREVLIFLLMATSNAEKMELLAAYLRRANSAGKLDGIEQIQRVIR